jgi:hypothetical protein
VCESAAGNAAGTSVTRLNGCGRDDLGSILISNRDPRAGDDSSSVKTSIFLDDNKCGDHGSSSGAEYLQTVKT